MDLAGQIFALIAIPSTLVLVVQTVLLLFGMGDDDVETDGIDLNGNGVGDTPGDGGGDGMALFSLRGIMAMAAVGGWSGLAMYDNGLPLTMTIILAAAFGFITLVGMAYIMRLASKLQSSGNIVNRIYYRQGWNSIYTHSAENVRLWQDKRHSAGEIHRG